MVLSQPARFGEAPLSVIEFVAGAFGVRSRRLQRERFEVGVEAQDLFARAHAIAEFDPDLGNEAGHLGG